MNAPYREVHMTQSDVTPAIEIRSVSKSFGSFLALDDVSLIVEKGLFLTLLGPSGCGKSTLLRAIAGFAMPDRGNVLVSGKDITREVPHRRPVSMVFQDYALFPHMSVRQNIGFGCEMQGMARRAISQRCDEMLALIRMPEIGDRYPEELSGGQRQRVSLARALAPDPVSLLLDEPLGALDLKLRLEMQQELKTIQRRTGKTFVFVTHDQEEAMSMSDLVAVMRDGRIEQIDTPEAIYNNPTSAFVAGFVGAANMLPVQAADSDSRTLTLMIGGTRWRVPRTRVTSRRIPADGEQATVVIRPETIRLSGTERDGDLVLRAHLEERTFLGGRVQLRLRTTEGQLVLVEARPQECDGIAGEVTLRCTPEDVAVLAEDVTLTSDQETNPISPGEK